jgi:SAM-dependent methyltransferase
MQGRNPAKVCDATAERSGSKAEEEKWRDRVSGGVFTVSDWQKGQDAFESQMHNEAMQDSLQVYLDEIESVRELYTQHFHLYGKILDVGGHQGRLRHYLTNDVTDYTSIDPIPFNLHEIESQPNLLRAYPCLLGRQSYVCKFYKGYAERLPFDWECFDWIHMRSVIDHFDNPLQAFAEAHRVCKHGGHMLVGLAIEEKIPVTLRSIIRNVIKPDLHTNRQTVASLHDLYKQTGWKVENEVWQKKPFDYCLYSQVVKE